MMAGAIEMLAAGVVLMIASMIAGEKLTALPSPFQASLRSAIWRCLVRLSPSTLICI
ncbi:hypothetical protein ACP0HM_09055 [Escherichia coli]